jgi:hypothetical protein
MTFLKCSECKKEIYKCDDCSEKFYISRNIICDKSSNKHYCDGECFADSQDNAVECICLDNKEDEK